MIELDDLPVRDKEEYTHERYQKEGHAFEFWRGFFCHILL